MCGIVGLFLKDKSLEPKLGEMLTDMLITMSDRGPDSAGIAVYGTDRDGFAKLTVQAADPSGFAGLDKALGKAIGADVTCRVIDTHAVLDLPEEKMAEARAALERAVPLSHHGGSTRISRGCPARPPNSASPSTRKRSTITRSAASSRRPIVRSRSMPQPMSPRSATCSAK